MRKALNEEAVRAIPYARTRREIFDRNCPGLCLRIGPKSKTWLIFYRDEDDRLVRFSLGRYSSPQGAEAADGTPHVGSYAWAKREADRLRANAANRRKAIPGAEDPRQERARRIEEAKVETPRRRPIRDWIEDYLKVPAHAARRSNAEVGRVLKAEVTPAIGDKRLCEVRRKDLEAIVRAKLEAGAPVQANRLRTYIKHLFKWASRKAEIEDPAREMEKETPAEEVRERYLSSDEIPLFWNATAGGDRYSDLFRFLLLTGLRKSEAAELRWSEVSLERQELSLGRTRTKTKKAQTFPLSVAAMEILRRQVRVGDSEFVFSGPNGKPLQNFSRAIRALNEAAGFDFERDDEQVGARLTIHDIRRSFRAGLDDVGTRFNVAETLIGHVVGSKAVQAYTHSEMVALKREAVERWAACVARIVEGTPANVVDFRAEAAR